MTLTVAQLIIKAFRDAKILKMNEVPSGGEMADALIDLNMILGQWSIEALMILASVLENFPLTALQYSYTIGIGGDFNTTKPSHIDDAYIQDASNVVYPCSITDLSVYRQYDDANISQGVPKEIIYDPGLTQQTVQTGTIWVYPIPDQSTTYTLYIGEQKPLTEFTSLTAQVTFQTAYFQALRSSLAEVLWPQYNDDGNPVPAYLKGARARAVANIVAMNARPGTMMIDMPKKGKGYNIYEGPFGGGYAGIS